MVEGNKKLEAAGFPVKRGMTGGGNGRFTFPCHSEPFMGEESMDPSVAKAPSRMTIKSTNKLK